MLLYTFQVICKLLQFIRYGIINSSQEIFVAIWIWNWIWNLQPSSDELLIKISHKTFWVQSAAHLKCRSKTLSKLNKINHNTFINIFILLFIYFYYIEQEDSNDNVSKLHVYKKINSISPKAKVLVQGSLEYVF